MTPVVVDTDVVSFLFKNDSRAQLYLPLMRNRDLLVSFMTEAELEQWILLAKWGVERARRFRTFMTGFASVPSSRDLILQWAEVMVAARANGRRIETADAWLLLTRGGSLCSAPAHPMERAYKVWLTGEQEDDLQRFARSRTLPARLVARAKMLVLGSTGHGAEEIAAQLGVARQTMTRWLGRFEAQGMKGMEDAPRSGRPPLILPSKIAEIVEKTTRETPDGATHWSTRTLAPVAGVSPSTVGRIWRAHGLKPHRVSSFKLSNDPRFAEKLEDVVGLYLHPPADATIWSLDEKCQIQALDRTQPGLPWKKGRCGTMTHDYKRHGTTTLFTAMNTQNGTVIDVCMPTHNHQDWIRFLKLIDGRTPKDKALHLIMDNYSAHKTPEVNAWLAKHPRIHVHFTPTSSSWLNQVERFFRDLTDKCIRRGVFHSVAELQQAMRVYIDRHNQNPKPFLWTAQAKDILEKVKRGWKALLARGYAPKKLAALQSVERHLAAAAVAAAP